MLAGAHRPFSCARGPAFRWLALIVLALPFAMFAWALPFASSTDTLGNDYVHYAPSAQLELMWSVHHGTFPLYLPGFARGHSTGAATLGQLYHPVAWLSSVMPGYGRGLALEWNTFFRLLSLGIAHLGLVALLRRLCLSPWAALLASFPVVYNLRMLDSFRFGPSVDGYAAMLFACAAAGFVFLDAGSKRPVALLALSTYLLAVSGHPQWMFFGLLIAGVFALAFPWIASAMRGGNPAPTRRDLARHVARLTAGFGSGLLAASPYLLTFYFEYFATNRSRTGNGYAWTLRWSDSVRGELDNFLFPFHADVHGAFAGSALFLIAALFPLARIVTRPPRVLWVFYGVAAFAFLFALGKATGLHRFVVTHVPLFTSVRTPGRLVLWIPVALLPIFAWLLRRSSRRGLAALGAGALALLAVGALLKNRLLPEVETFSPRAIDNAVPASFDGIVLALLAATIVLLTLAAARRKGASLLLASSLACAIASTWLCLFDGTWREDKGPTATFDAIAAQRATSVDVHLETGEGMETSALTEYVSRGIRAARDLGTLEHDVKHRSPDAAVLDALKKRHDPNTLFLDRRVARMSDEPAPAASAEDRVHLAYNTSNRFVFDVDAARDGYFVLGLPWVPGFACWIDGAPATVARGNALFPAVFVPRGSHRVDLRFVSRPFLVGLALSLATGWAWIVVTARRRRQLAAGLGLIGALAVGAVAYRSLFFGPSFGTRYDWTPSAGATPVREEPRRPADLELSSTSVTRGGPMPRALGCADDEHLGRSPALAWSRGPEGTVAYAITMIDMDAKGFVHWALVVPPTVQSLPEGASPGGPIPDGSFEMRNDFGKAGYGGPCPPPGARHDYALQVTALGTPMKSARTTTAFLRAVDEKFIALGSLAFTFER